MKTLRTCLCVLLALTMLTGTLACDKKDKKKEEPTATETPDVPDDPVIPDDPEPKLKPRDKSAQLKVLFIGNSFTYYNNMNQSNGTFFQIANKTGYTGVSVSTIYKGGYYLHQFLDPNDSYGKQVLTALNSDTKYDIVIIQEQSANPIGNPADFYTCCRQFKELIDKNGGEMWLYSTWGYETGHKDLKKYGKTPAEMEMKLRAAYTAIGEELNVPVIFAGAAMTKAYEMITTTSVYDADKKHPSPAGSYLIACTIFGTVFGVDPLEINFDSKVPAANAAALRAIASEIVNSDITVDPKYATKSEGVGTK